MLHTHKLNELTKDQAGKTVKVAAWVYAVRRHGGITFLLLRDRTGTMQSVVTKDKKQLNETVASLSPESVVLITGTIKVSKQAPGGLEIAIDDIQVLSEAVPELPIPVVQKVGSDVDVTKRMDWRWLDLRKPKNQLIFRVWTVFEQAFREYWTDHDYIQIHSPKLMSTPSESGSELFKVEYFDEEAYLAQSPQFYKQMAMAAGFERVFEIGPVFRAEPSFTSRHATEYTGYDAEISFIESHQDVIKEQEGPLINALKHVKEEFGKDIKEHFAREVVVPKAPFPQLTMAEAKEILAKRGVKSDRTGDLTPEEEREISTYVKEQHGHEFVFITEYPVTVRPFYHMRLESDSTLTKSFDLLWNGIEVTTGAQREHRYDVLRKQAKEKKINLASVEFYLNFFKVGCPPHGGIGMGPARMLMKLLNLDNIRETTFLYRGVKRLRP